MPLTKLLSLKATATFALDMKEISAIYRGHRPTPLKAQSCPSRSFAFLFPAFCGRFLPLQLITDYRVSVTCCICPSAPFRFLFQSINTKTDQKNKLVCWLVSFCIATQLHSLCPVHYAGMLVLIN